MNVFFHRWEDIEILPHSTKKVPLGLVLEIPSGFFGLLKDRSSVAMNESVFVLAGVVDAGWYTS